jgi:hypothetical protein
MDDPVRHHEGSVSVVQVVGFSVVLDAREAVARRAGMTHALALPPSGHGSRSRGCGAFRATMPVFEPGWGHTAEEGNSARG